MDIRQWILQQLERPKLAKDVIAKMPRRRFPHMTALANMVMAKEIVVYQKGSQVYLRKAEENEPDRRTGRDIFLLGVVAEEVFPSRDKVKKAVSQLYFLY